MATATPTRHRNMIAETIGVLRAHRNELEAQMSALDALLPPGCGQVDIAERHRARRKLWSRYFTFRDYYARWCEMLDDQPWLNIPEVTLELHALGAAVHRARDLAIEATQVY